MNALEYMGELVKELVNGDKQYATYMSKYIEQWSIASKQASCPIAMCLTDEVARMDWEDMEDGESASHIMFFINPKTMQIQVSFEKFMNDGGFSYSLTSEDGKYRQEQIDQRVMEHLHFHRMDRLLVSLTFLTMSDEEYECPIYDALIEAEGDPIDVGDVLLETQFHNTWETYYRKMADKSLDDNDPVAFKEYTAKMLEHSRTDYTTA